MSNGRLPFPSTVLWLCFGSLTLQLLLSTPDFTIAFSLSPGVVVLQGTKNRHPTCNELRRRRRSSIHTINNNQPFCTNVALQSSSIDDSDGSVGDNDNYIVDDDKAAEIDLGDDLTKYELGLRLKEVRDYYRKTNEMSQENVCLSLFRTRFSKLRLNRCYHSESTIEGAGRGLFAARDIEEGELITLYPGDILLQWEASVGDFSADVGVLFGSHVNKEDHQKIADRLTSNDARAYELTIGRRHSVVADPLQDDDPAYLGHFPNDAAILTSRDQQSIDQYNQKSGQGLNAANLILEGSHFVTVATKNIKKDQEIFVSYGYQYWVSRANPNSQKKNGNKKITKKKETKKKTKKNSGSNKGFGKK